MLKIIQNPYEIPGTTACTVLFEAGCLPELKKQGLELPPSLETAAAKRQSEFLAGRYCARQALKELLVPIAEQKVGTLNRAPVWPAGITGSITHTSGLARAVCSQTSNYRSLGVDTEILTNPEKALKLASQIMDEREQSLAGNLSQRDLFALIFSAKESIFKAIFPLTQQFFGYSDARIFSLKAGEFSFELCKDLDSEFKSGYIQQGNYLFDESYVHTSVVIV